MYAADETYDTAELEDADISPTPCSNCGATETVEISQFDGRYEQSILICAECGSDEP